MAMKRLPFILVFGVIGFAIGSILGLAQSAAIMVGGMGSLAGWAIAGGSGTLGFGSDGDSGDGGSDGGGGDGGGGGGE
jgi:hypothetical protein